MAKKKKRPNRKKKKSSLVSGVPAANTNGASVSTASTPQPKEPLATPSGSCSTAVGTVDSSTAAVAMKSKTQSATKHMRERGHGVPARAAEAEPEPHAPLRSALAREHSQDTAGAQHDDNDSSSSEEEFGQKVDLTRAIQNVLKAYPEGLTILQELVQNVSRILFSCCGMYRESLSSASALGVKIPAFRMLPCRRMTLERELCAYATTNARMRAKA